MNKITQLWTQNKILWKIALEKNKQNTKKIIIFWTQRILNDLIEYQKSPSEQWWLNLIISEIERQILNWVSDLINECNIFLNNLSYLNDKSFLDEFMKLNSKIQSLFDYIENQKTILIKEEAKNKNNSRVTNLTEKINNLWKKIKESLKLFWKLIIVSSLTISTVSSEIKSSISEILPQNNNPYNYKESDFSWVNSESRRLFEILKKNPEKIKFIANFDENIRKIELELRNTQLFNENFYIKWVSWKIWNLEIAKILFPNINNISQNEANIVIKALELHFQLKTTNWQFWPKSKKELLKKLGSLNLDNTWISEDDIKRVSIWTFEHHLFKFEWVKYVPWQTDCSWTIMQIISMLTNKNLADILPINTWWKLSTSIITKLTKDKRHWSFAKKWDFIYWKSKRSKNQSHIWYVIDRDEKWIYIFDSSTDTWVAKKRFLPWESLARKKDCIVGTPTFIDIW